eukprot:s325_g10.t1
MALPNVARIRFAQGLMGSYTPKPTHLLNCNRVRTELPRAGAIGRDKEGRWRTSVLKEYALAMCKSLAGQIIQAFDNRPTDTDVADPPEEFLALCAELTCTEYGQRVGADFSSGVM